MPPAITPALQQAGIYEAARRWFLPFVKLTFPQYEAFPVHRLLAEEIQNFVKQVERRESPRLMLFCQPRLGKSELVSRKGPPWILGNHPDWNVGIVSYGAELAEELSADARRVVMDDQFKATFGSTYEIDPGSTVALDRASKSVAFWRIAGHRGGLRAVGIGGALTGRGFDCLTGESTILTEYGPRPIQRLVRSGYNGRVWSFNHERGVPELRNVIARRAVKKRVILEVRTVQGRTFRCTPAHRVYIVGRGYKPAALLRPGDPVVASDHLSPVRWDQRPAPSDVPVLLCQNQTTNRGATLLQLPGAIPSQRLPVRKGEPARAPRPLLLADVLAGASRRQERQEVRPLWRADAGEVHQSLLRQGLSNRPSSETNEGLPVLRNDVHAADQPAPVLFEDMRQRSARAPHAWGRQFPLQDGLFVREMVRRNAPPDLPTGPASLRGLSTSGSDLGHPLARSGDRSDQSPSPSRERGRDGQHAGEPGDAVLNVPRDPSQVRIDTVAVVRRLRSKPIEVYDLQVEGNRNFFANGVLVHNCLIIDDPIKGRKEADSKAVKDDLWKFWRGTLRTRLEPGGGVILMQTRWAVDDLAGRLLKTRSADKWRVVSIPAICEDEATDPLHRRRGEKLEGRFEGDELDDVREDIGEDDDDEREWNAQYQQRPLPEEGAVFRIPDDIRFEDPPANYRGPRYLFADTSFGKTQESDYSDLQVWQVEPGGALGLLDNVHRRVPFPDLKREARKLYLKYGCWGGIIEDYGSGTSLIQEFARDSRMRILPWVPDRDKRSRGFAATGVMRGKRLSGGVKRVRFPKDPYFPSGRKVADLLESMRNFTGLGDAHDDDVDTLTCALILLGTQNSADRQKFRNQQFDFEVA